MRVAVSHRRSAVVKLIITGAVSDSPPVPRKPTPTVTWYVSSGASGMRGATVSVFPATLAMAG
jgi:hypothetical protein